MKPSDIAIEKAAHDYSFLLATWKLCDKAACRRAHVCRGAGRACLKAKFPLLPQDVQDWFIGFIWHKMEGVPFEEAWHNLERSTLAPALRAWHADAEERAR